MRTFNIGLTLAALALTGVCQAQSPASVAAEQAAQAPCMVSPSTRCYKPSVQVAFGPRISKYVAPVILGTTLPRNDGVFDSIVLTASSTSGRFSNLVYHTTEGWVDETLCGFNSRQILKYCGLVPG